MRGSRILAVRGRKSGEWRTTPVNLLNHEGKRYLVAPRGDTQWSRNVRAAGGGELRLGSQARAVRACDELPDAEKPASSAPTSSSGSSRPASGSTASPHDSPDEDVARIAPDHPVFEILSTTPA